MSSTIPTCAKNWAVSAVLIQTTTSHSRHGNAASAKSNGDELWPGPRPQRSRWWSALSVSLRCRARAGTRSCPARQGKPAPRSPSASRQSNTWRRPLSRPGPKSAKPQRCLSTPRRSSRPLSRRWRRPKPRVGRTADGRPLVEGLIDAAIQWIPVGRAHVPVDRRQHHRPSRRRSAHRRDGESRRRFPCKTRRALTQPG